MSLYNMQHYANHDEHDKEKSIIRAFSPQGRSISAIISAPSGIGLTSRINIDCVYGVVDLHAMTMPYDPKVAAAKIR